MQRHLQRSVADLAIVVPVKEVERFLLFFLHIWETITMMMVGTVNYTNVQLCSSQVNKGKSDIFSEKFVFAKKKLCENFLGENLLDEHFLSEHFFF